jgi:thermitase
MQFLAGQEQNGREGMKAGWSLKTAAVVVSILLALIIAQSLWAQNDSWQSQFITVSHAPDRILVKFHSTAPENVKAAIHKYHRGKILDLIPGIDLHIVQISKNTIKEKLRAYRSEAWVEYAEPDYVAYSLITPDDKYFKNQWGMVKIQAPQAWDLTRGLANIKIAICDTGIDRHHEDLASKVVLSRNLTSSPTVSDVFGHGTHVAGIAAAITNNAQGVAGIGFNSSLMNIKVMGDDGTGYMSWIASGITYAADNGAKVINLSLGSSAPSATLENAVNYAWQKGVVVVAAAGNAGTNQSIYPAYYPNCISVAATDPNDAKANFSTYGTWVDVAAPGVNIYSTLPSLPNQMGRRDYGYASGTSMAAPHVTGIAALVWATGYGTGNASVRDRILRTAEKAGDIWSSYQIERVNAYRAVGGP